MPHFDWTFTVTNVLAIGGLVLCAILAWRDHEWRMKNLESWKDAHEHATVKALENITYLREIASKMEAMIKGQNRRLEMLEDGQHRDTRPH